MNNRTENNTAEDANTAHYVGRINYQGQSRVLLLTPVTPANNDEGPYHLDDLPFLSSTTVVDSAYCPGAPSSIRTVKDADQAAPFVTEKVKWAEQQGYDAVIINCMLDPGLQAAKAAARIPVIGIREANSIIARMIGSNPATIYPDEIDILNLNSDPEKTYADLLAIGRQKIINQGADVLLPNCAYLGGLAQRLQEELNVPVLANRDVALKFGELLATFHLKKESPRVAATRSRKKMMISKIYRLPAVGELIYGMVLIMKKVIGRA